MDPVGQQDSRASIFEYVLTYHDSYEYRFSWLPCLTQIKVVTSSVTLVERGRGRTIGGGSCGKRTRDVIIRCYRTTGIYTFG